MNTAVGLRSAIQMCARADILLYTSTAKFYGLTVLRMMMEGVLSLIKALFIF
jgi:hypothetical protein